MLELRAVNAGYGAFQVLFDISLGVTAGEAVGVIGPNGAGKTSLLRAISRLVEIASGEVEFEGKRIERSRPEAVTALGIAHVPENRRLFPGLTVEENLRMGAFLPSQRSRLRERLEFVYDLFPRIRERRGQVAGTLSGGEQQMCAIARGLMSGPRLLLLDEPSAGLAPVIVQQLFALIERIRTEGYTVLIVEQNIQQVLRIVDRAYLLEVGRIKATGTADELSGNEEIRRAYIGI